LVTGFLLVPVLHLLVKGLGSALTVAEPLPAYLWPHLFQVTKNTFILGAFATSISLLIALPLAFLLVRTNIVASRIWLSLLTIPMITPPFIMAFAVLSLYGRSGIVSLLLQRVGIFTPHIFGLPGLLINQLIVSIPYATFIIAAGLQGVPRHIDETAASMGTPNIRVILDLTIPCISPHIIISGLMIFLMAIGDIGGPLVIGGGFAVLSSEIYTNFLSMLNDERVALIFSLWIIMLSFLLLAIVNRLIRSTAREYRRGLFPLVYPLGRYRIPATILVVLIFILLLAPFLMTLVQSFITIWSYDLLPQGWTLLNYQKVFRTPGMLVDTLQMAVLATSVIVFFGIILGHTMYHRRTWLFMDYILVIPFVLPGIVLAVGVLGAYAGFFPQNHPIPFYALLLFTIIARRLPYSLKTLEAGFLVADSRREEVARSLGDNQLTAFLRITLPQMKPFVFAAIIVGLVKTSTELSASLILAPANWKSLSLGIMDFIDQGQLSMAAALSIMLVAVVGLGTVLVAFWSQKPAGLEAKQSHDALERLILGRTPMAMYEGSRRVKKKKQGFSLHGRSREPYLILVDRKGIVEANQSFLKLVGADSLTQVQAETSFSTLFFGDREVLELFTSMESIENRATSMLVLDGSRIPIILHAYVMMTDDGFKRAILYCHKVTGYSRRVKEYTRLREQMMIAQQMALKAQITPHFLFNSLNSVMQLIDSNPKEANETLQNLADLYRYILTSTKLDLVSVDEEIASMHHYLKVEKARFGIKLNYKVEKDPVVSQFQIPPMLIQPIVENAVNHGAKATGEIDITISVYPGREGVIVCVEDQGDSVFDPFEVASGTGTGLKNVEGRLFALYHRKIAYERKMDGGLKVTMTIPGNLP
jgi:iron(III) transport system permease protein